MVSTLTEKTGTARRKSAVNLIVEGRLKQALATKYQYFAGCNEASFKRRRHNLQMAVEYRINTLRSQKMDAQAHLAERTLQVFLRVTPADVCRLMVQCIIVGDMEGAFKAKKRLTTEFKLGQGNVNGKLHRVARKVRRHTDVLVSREQHEEARLILRRLERVRETNRS